MNGIERESSLPREKYLEDAYFTPQQMSSLMEQFMRIRIMRPETILEVGLGNGMLAAMLRQIGIKVTTVDVNPNLEPDIVSDIKSLPLKLTSKFDIVVCCEVLEHIRFDEFEENIRIFKSLSNNLFLTLPFDAKHFGFAGILRLPKKGTREIGFWWRTKITKKIPSEHFWEIGHSLETSKKNIKAIITKFYPSVEVTHFKMNPYHTCFLCQG